MRNTAAHAKAKIEANEDRDTGFDVLEPAELGLVGGALVNEGGVVVEESPPSEGLVVDETVGLGSLETVAPPWIASLEIYSVCVAVLLCTTIVHIARVLSENVHPAPIVN